MDPGTPSIRTEMVEKAMKFILDEKVSRTGTDVQKQFLTKKGLTDQEIIEAVARAEEQKRILPTTQADPSPGISYQQPSTSYQRSKWADYANTIVLAGGVTYLTVQFVKSCIMPKWLGVPTKQQKQMQSLQDSVTDVQNNLKFLVDSVQQTLIVVQKQQDISNKLLLQLNSKGDSSKNLERVLADLRNEVSVVKSLLLSRDQFPPVPVNKNFSLPSWQQIKPENHTENGVFSPTLMRKRAEGDFKNNGLLNGNVSFEEDDDEDNASGSINLNADEKVTPV